MADQVQVLVAPVPSQIPTGVPPGLEFLIPTNQVIIQEIKQWGFFTSNYRKQYNVLDAFGRRMYYAAENPAMSGCCGGSDRYWTIDLLNQAGQIVLSGNRTGGAGCDSNQVFVMNPAIGQTIGGIVQEANCCATDKWHIVNGAQQPVLYLDSPFFKTGWGTKEFPILTMQEPRQQVGRITKAFQGMFSTVDVFGVEFPVNMDVSMKAVLIYASFLIHFMYYQDPRTGE